MKTLSLTTTSPSRGLRDEDILAWTEIIESTARSLASSPDARRAGVEYDDLVQEGYFSVILSLRRGVNPMLVLGNRMKDWIRYQKRQREGDPIPYETLLPTEAPDGPV